MYLLLGFSIFIILYSILFLYQLFLSENNSAKSELFRDKYSKIKNIYIELYNYTFFHSPASLKKKYKNFVGRDRLTQKLKSIFTTSETKSGAYLITGFRGMGKTSLVRKVLSDIKGNHHYSFYKHVRFFIILVVLNIFKIDKLVEDSIGWNTFYFLIFLGLWYLIWHDRHRPNRFQYYQRYGLFFSPLFRIYYILISALRVLNTEQDYYWRSNFKSFIQTVVIITLQFKIAHSFVEGTFLEEFISIIWVSLSFFVIIYFLDNYRIERRLYPGSFPFERFFKAFKRIIINAIKRVDFGDRVMIEISLSQDELKEEDLLRLLTKNIYVAYRSLRRRIFAPNHLVLPFLLFLSAYSIGGLFFYNHTNYAIINEYRLGSGICNYFPSQALFNSNIYDLQASTGKIINKCDILINKSEDSTNQLKNKDLVEEFINEINCHISVAREVSDDSCSKKNNDKLVYSFLDYSSDNTEVKSEGKLYKPSYLIYIQHWTNYLDYLLFVQYHKIFSDSDNLLQNTKRTEENRFFQKTFNVSKDFHFPPFHLDLFFIIFLFLILYIGAIIFNNSHRVGIVNHKYILSRLEALNENLHANIQNDTGKNIDSGGLKIFSFFSRKQKMKPIAEVREIESELIDILNEIDNIPSISSHPEFIFIFDELDKIDAYNVNIVEKENEELTSFGKGDSGYFSVETIRKRQEAIIRILGNLKLFFNTARAKFIFIAGREMFDAALADISDRDSFISSVFHEVLYVNSFFKDPANKGTAGITGLTEKFVCQLLMPPSSDYEKTLKGYHEYLKNEFEPGSSFMWEIKMLINKFFDYKIFSDYDFELNKFEEERRKVIYTLHNFITYLIYRSNGSPKKITKLLEEFIRKPERDEFINPESSIIGKNDSNLYLYFNYSNQYRIGFIDYLFKPYLLANSRHMSDYEDKLLIATSFLMDHLYKYHNTGFSWSNLELTPEVISINKSPKLRDFINDLLNFLSNYHTDKILNGLHQFKFSKKIANEFSFLSKINDYESAAFNFTLDESLQLKKHYRKKLNQLNHYYKNFLQKQQSGFDHINSIAFINMTLGDLHFFDQEYDEALFHYMDAVQPLSTLNFELMERHQFLILIQSYLKQGVTNEKMKNYSMAFSCYGRLSKMMRDFAKYFLGTIYTKGDKDYEEEKLLIKRRFFENIKQIYQPFIARLHLIEKGSPNGVTSVDIERTFSEIQDIFINQENNEKFLVEVEYHNKVGNLLFYKNGNLLKGNLKVAEHDHFFGIGIDSEEKPVKDSQTKAIFYNRLKMLQEGKIEPQHNIIEELGIIKSALNAIEYRKKKTVNEYKDFTSAYFGGEENSYWTESTLIGYYPFSNEPSISSTHLPISAYNEYILSLNSFSRKIIQLFKVKKTYMTPLPRTTYVVGLDSKTNFSVEFNNRLKSFSKHLDIVKICAYYIYSSHSQRAFVNQNEDLLISIANCLSDLGDTLICFGNENSKICPKTLFSFLEDFDSLTLSRGGKKDNILSNYFKHLENAKSCLERAIMIFILAGQYFYLGNKYNKYGLQLRKILYLIKSYNHPAQNVYQVCLERNNDIKNSKDEIRYFKTFDLIGDKVVTEILQNIDLATSNTRRQEIFENSNILNSKWNRQEQKKIFFDSRVLEPDAKETLIIYNELLIQFNSYKLSSLSVKESNSFLNEIHSTDFDLVSPYSTVNNRFLRCQSLNYKVNLNTFLIRLLGLDENFCLLSKILKTKVWFEFDSENAYPKLNSFIEFLRKIKEDSSRKLKSYEMQRLIRNIDKFLKDQQPIIGSGSYSEDYFFQKIIQLFNEQEIKEKLKTYKTEFLNFLFKDDKDNFSKSDLVEEIIEYLIVDTLYCLSEVIKSYNIFGLGYITTHVFLANAHKEMGDWCSHFHSYLEILNILKSKRKEKFEEKLRRMVGKLDVNYLDVGYHYQIAIHHYEEGLSLHNGGKIYGNVIQEMYYLDDNYSDTLGHFCTAMERYRINTGYIAESIDYCKYKIKEKDIFDEKDYLVQN